MQGAGEGAAAEPLAGLGLFLEQLAQRLGDVLVDLAVLLRGEPRGDTDVADVELLRFLPHGKTAQVGAAREQRLQLLLEVALGFHGIYASTRTLHVGCTPGSRPVYGVSLQDSLWH